VDAVGLPSSPAADQGPPLVAALDEGDGGDGRELARILETMPAAFLFLDRDWRLRRVNATAERLIGRSRRELQGRVLWELFPELTGSVYESSFRQAAAERRPVAFEAMAVDGTAFFEVRAWPAPDGLAVYYLDVSERHRAEEIARRSGQRVTLLARVSADLAGALDSESALGRLARLVVPTLADGCIVTVVDREGRPRDVGSWHEDPARRAVLERYTRVRLDSLPPTSPVGRALRVGEPATEPVSAVLALMPPGESRDLLAALRFRTAVVLPLTAEERTVGVLTLYLDDDREVTGDDLATAREVGAQAGRAVARVHRQSQQAKLAEGLQRSLLTQPPEIPGTAVVVRYVPAAEAARVGGDWYDAFLQRDGRPMLVIGDVVGHDTAAAAAMGQLRGLLRGIAHHSGAGPAEVLRGLDEAMAAMYDGTMATAAVARLEGAGADGCGVLLRWANAGHPPPAVLRPDRSVELLTADEYDLMLGVDPTVARAESVVVLPPGTTVLLYTDGLVERRGTSLDEGFARLQRHLAELAGLPLDALCDLLLERMLGGTPSDDVALVAVTVAVPCAAGAPRPPAADRADGTGSGRS
jgi:PAS domain S-box-containing protein